MLNFDIMFYINIRPPIKTKEKKDLISLKKILYIVYVI